MGMERRGEEYVIGHDRVRTGTLWRGENYHGTGRWEGRADNIVIRNAIRAGVEVRGRWKPVVMVLIWVKI